MELTKQYRKLLNRNNKVLNIHHKDLDGAASSIVVKNVYDDVEFRELRYGEVNNYLKTINFDKYDVVLLTDISPESIEAFDISDKIFLLDHHDTALEYHDPSKNRIVLNGKCAALLVKDFFENLFNIDLSHLNDFVNIVNDYDMWYLQDPRSWGMNELYFKYWDTNFRVRFSTGNTYYTNHEVDFIKKRRKELEETYNNLDRYDFEDIKGTLIIANMFVNDLCHKLMSDRGYKLVCSYNPKSKNISVRSVEPNIHVGEMLRELFSNGAGGHKNSGAFKINDYSEINDKLDIIENYLKGKI